MSSNQNFQLAVHDFQSAHLRGKLQGVLARITGRSNELLSYEEIASKLKLQGRSLDETIAAKPTATHDAKWGQFVITPALFTKLVYEGV